MVKLRDARYCNLKLFLMFLVIYGHFIEPGIWQSQELMTQYRCIYLFHMPLFCFLSGLFMSNGRACASQIKRTLPLYAVLQIAAVLLSNGELNLSTPCWLLWYLLSYSTWAGVGWFWYRFCREKGRRFVLVIAILVGCLAGMVPFVGRDYSLSRTLVFFPYFWMGLICDSRLPWEKLRPAGVLALAVVTICMLSGGNEIPVDFLYHAEPYGTLENGFLLRLACYMLGALLCLFFLSFAPTKRFPFTKAGADTMPAYLAHAPVAVCLWGLDAPWALCLLTTALFLYLTCKASQWFGDMYGVVPAERGDSGWLPFKRSTKNTRNRFTVSCYL